MFPFCRVDQAAEEDSDAEDGASDEERIGDLDG